MHNQLTYNLYYLIDCKRKNDKIIKIQSRGCENMWRLFARIADFIRETDKILFLLCFFASSYGCIAVMSATYETIYCADRMSYYGCCCLRQ